MIGPIHTNNNNAQLLSGIPILIIRKIWCARTMLSRKESLPLLPKRLRAACSCDT